MTSSFPDNAHDGMPSESSNAAMNLFARYSSLNRSIDETRAEMAKTRSETERIQERIAQVQQEREDMQIETTRASSEANELHRQVDEATEELSEVQHEQRRTLMEHQRAKRALEGTKSFIQEQRRNFLEESREFRASCKRLRVRATAMGLGYAPLQAFANVMTMDHQEVVAANGGDDLGDSSTSQSFQVNPDVFQEIEQGLRYPPAEIPTGSDDNHEESAGSDPETWKPHPLDDEMIESKLKYREALDKQRLGIESLQEVQERRKVAVDRASGRSQRYAQLLSQLKRIEQDIDNLEVQIAETNQDTVEAQDLAKNFERDVKRRRQEEAQRRFEESGGPAPPAVSTGHPQNPRPLITAAAAKPRTNNPYIRTNRTSTSPSARNNSKHTIAGTGTTSTARDMDTHPRSRRTNLQQQHPHRAGRIRVDRRFSTNLGVTGGFDNVTEEEGEFENNSLPRGSQRPSLSSLAQQYDMDDEDDSELMNFEVFAKR